MIDVLDTVYDMEKLIKVLMEKENTNEVKVKLVKGMWEVTPIHKKKPKLKSVFSYKESK